MSNDDDNDVDDKIITKIPQKSGSKPKINKKVVDTDESNIDESVFNFDDFENELKQAKEEVHLPTSTSATSSKPDKSKSNNMSKDNDDSDKSDSDDGWTGVQDDINIDDVLGNMEFAGSPPHSNGGLELDDMSLKIEELTDKVDNINDKTDENHEVIFKELTRARKDIKLMKNDIREIKEMLMLLTGKTVIGDVIEGNKPSVIDVNDKDDPVNKSGYFEKES